MNKITYTKVGDYLLPDLKLSDTSDTTHTLGKYGMLHKNYLKREKPALYAKLLLSEQLYPLCREIDISAENRLIMLDNQELAHEIILAELVFV